MKTVKILNSKKEVFKLVKKAAHNIGLDLNGDSLSKGILLLYSTGSFFSFGNKIEVKISSSKHSGCLIEVSSQSSTMLQVIDWGTNNEIEEQLIEEIKNLYNEVVR